jgi:RHS repeat-associated protein
LASVSDTNVLDYMQARYYNPNIGRFSSVDPVLGNAGNPRSWDRYTYCRDNPILYVDPDGRSITVWAPRVNGVKQFWWEFWSGGIWKLLNEAGGSAFEHSGAGVVMAGIKNDSASQVARGTGGLVRTALTVGGAAKIVRTILRVVKTTTVVRVFWSGSRTAMSAAAEWASNNGGTTLEATTAGQAIDQQAGWEAAQTAWSEAAQTFAAGASGEVASFQAAEGVSIDSVWASVEYPALMNNPNVTGIQYFIVYGDGAVAPLP